jgi:hypothetical protein
VLASGQVTQSDQLSIELVTPLGNPPVVRLNWPSKATTLPPEAYAETASRIMRVLARASTELARIKASRRL